MIPIARPLLGEEEQYAALAVLASGVLAQGPQVKIFEEGFAGYCGVNHAIATSSGTTALHLALLAHGIGPGDEVITTPFTFIASANAILYVRAKPVFVDIDPATFNIDPALIEAAVTPRTRAIMPVHLFGMPAAMEPIMAIAERHKLVIIEDACQAHGAEYRGRRVGSFGTGCFSFYPTKNMTTTEGGMITTNDERIADRCRLLRQHGMRQRYYHEELGYNFRLTELQAAIGVVQLRRLDGFNARRGMNAYFLSRHLRSVVTPTVPPGSTHVFHQYTVRVPDGQRNALLEGLLARGIGAAVYYPLPVHRQPAYQELADATDLPEAERASQEVLSLPVHPGLTQTDLETIVDGVNLLC